MLDSYSTRFWSKVDKSGGVNSCWLWTGARLKTGYGKFTVAHQTWDYAHRVAYRLIHGDILPGRVIMHTCDNPSCVNPAHLRMGTAMDNVQDKIAKGRDTVGDHKGVRNAKAKLNDDKVRLIRKRLTEGETCAQLAREYGVTKESIWSIKVGETWKHVR